MRDMIVISSFVQSTLHFSYEIKIVCDDFCIDSCFIEQHFFHSVYWLTTEVPDELIRNSYFSNHLRQGNLYHIL
jgi:hypothetical protein